MKANKLAALIVTTYIGFISTAHASAPQPVFSPEQEARIGEIAADYLVSHPEILVTVSQKLQANIWWSLGSFTSGCAAGADGLAKERAPGLCHLSQCHLRHRS